MSEREYLQAIFLILLYYNSWYCCSIIRVCAQLELDEPFREIQTTLVMEKPIRPGHVNVAEEGQLIPAAPSTQSLAHEKLRKLREELNKCRKNSEHVLTVPELNALQVSPHACIQPTA